jgi:Ca-activated chloride channel family protein
VTALVRRLPQLVAVAVLWSAPASAQVSIVTPAGGESVAGEVAIAAAVRHGTVVSFVEFRVDGKVVGRASAPPWELRVDVGADNVEHRFEAVAYGDSGELGRAVVVTPRIRVDEEIAVQLQQLYVTATLRDRRVLGLDRSNFTVVDGGETQRLITFERGDVPFTAVILLDASESMKGEKMQAALDGARAFVGGMKPLDEARVVAFSDRLLGATPFRAGGSQGAGDLPSGIEADGGTALNDQLYAALHLLERRQGRRVVIVLSDGLDSHSALSIDDVLPLASRSRALLYWVRLVAGGPQSPDFAPRLQHSAWRNGAAHARQIDRLEDAVVKSGGRVAMLRTAAEIPPTFVEVLSELREQYVLGYYPTNARNDGSWRPVRVRAPIAGLELRTSTGYLDF